MWATKMNIAACMDYLCTAVVAVILCYYAQSSVLYNDTPVTVHC